MLVKSILLVEDSIADAYVIQRAVQDCGHNLKLWTMTDGVEALMFLRKDYPLIHVPTPFLIIVDLGLPKMSGAQLIAEIRQLLAHRATPIVVLSAKPKEKEEGLCFQLGATEYVQKSTSDFSAYFNSIKALVMHWLRPESV